MNTYYKYFILSLALLALVVMATPSSASAQAVCPAGYICKPIASSTPPVSVQPACYQFNNNLTVGSTGSEVVALQTWLISNGYNIALISSGRVAKGYFGPATSVALGAYQKSVDILATGELDADTRGKLNTTCNVTSTIVNNPNQYSTDRDMVPVTTIPVTNYNTYNSTYTTYPGYDIDVSTLTGLSKSDAIIRMYQALQHRMPEPGGLQYWTSMSSDYASIK